MKKILKMLVLGLLSAALLCCALPSAFAAEQKDAQIYTIGLDAMGGTSSVVAVTTNLNGKLSALPAQPTLDGYTFDGWYTETVGGTKVTTSTVFRGYHRVCPLDRQEHRRFQQHQHLQARSARADGTG